MFLLGFIDSAGIPVAAGMDALIILIGVKAPSRAYLTALVAVMGSLGGNLLLFYGARKGGQRFAEKQGGAPRDSRFRQWFVRYGLSTVFIPAVVPLIPLPLKVFVITAGVLRTSPVQFTLVVLLARAIHYFGVAWLAIQLGNATTDYLKSHVWHLAGGAVLLAALLYGVVRYGEKRRASIAGE